MVFVISKNPKLESGIYCLQFVFISPTFWLKFYLIFFVKETFFIYFLQMFIQFTYFGSQISIGLI